MRPDASTQLYGILGHPVAHSLSPAMHNAAFEALDINAVYLAFDVTDLQGAVHGIRALNLRGASVTIPHKVAVMELLDEIDNVAARIGAVNTVVNRTGRLLGANTDWLGAVKALEEKTVLEGKRVIVLGAGGSARAVCAGLAERGVSVHVANRTEKKARDLAETLGCTWSGLGGVDRLEADILVNTTSVGMAPLVDRIPVPADILGHFRLVMDIIYAPVETKLLKQAAIKGCETINGIRMLLLQAVAQFEMWTGKVAPVNVMEEVLYRRLKADRQGNTARH